jgi:hypothetical protein
LPTVVYNIPEDVGRWGQKTGDGFVMGAYATLNTEGAKYEAPKANMATKLAAATTAARGDYAGVASR